MKAKILRNYEQEMIRIAEGDTAAAQQSVSVAPNPNIHEGEVDNIQPSVRQPAPDIIHVVMSDDLHRITYKNCFTRFRLAQIEQMADKNRKSTRSN